MPDVSLLQPLCAILEISVNELLSGERIPAEAYREKAETTMSSLFRENQSIQRKPAKSLFAVSANCCLLVAVAELAVGLIGGLVSPGILKPLLTNACVWTALFLLSTGKLVYDKNKLSRRKRSGVFADAEIEDILPAAWFRVGNYVCCSVVCRYVCEGRSYRAKGGFYVLTPLVRKEELRACVYCERSDPSQCSVELFE